MLRNLGKMSQLGLFERGADPIYTRLVVKAFNDENRLRGGRVHPIKILTAKLQYQKGMSGAMDGPINKLTQWAPNSAITHALDKAFYFSFKVASLNFIYLILALSSSYTYKAVFLYNFYSIC